MREVAYNMTKDMTKDDTEEQKSFKALEELLSENQKHQDSRFLEISAELKLMRESIKSSIEETISNMSQMITGEMKENLGRKLTQSLELCTVKLASLELAIENTASKLRKSQMNTITKWLLTIACLMFISLISSVGASYLMMQYFPQRVSIDAGGDISVKDSTVHLWDRSGQGKIIK